jgi:tRNA-2-methylthio-N6-dimethylallyladenosine synthase
MEVVERCGYDQAFTFLYSPREGTPATRLTDAVPAEVAQERFDRLVTAIQTSAHRKNQALIGSVQEVLVEGGSRRDSTVITGRTAGNKVVHAAAPEGATPTTLAGRFASVNIEEAQTWFLTGAIQGYERP